MLCNKMSTIFMNYVGWRSKINFERLRRYNGVDAEVLPHPPQALAYRTEEPEGFVLSVKDNGCGFPPESPEGRTPPKIAHPAHGNGLRNMRERAEAMGGALLVTSAAKKGTRLRMTFPI